MEESGKAGRDGEERAAADGGGREFSQGKTRLRLFPERREFFVFLN